MFAFCYLPISEKYKSLINVRQNYFDLIILKYLIILHIRNVLLNSNIKKGSSAMVAEERLFSLFTF